MYLKVKWIDEIVLKVLHGNMYVWSADAFSSRSQTGGLRESPV